MNSVYAVGAVMALILAAFIIYYVFRLVSASSHPDDSECRLAALLPEVRGSWDRTLPASLARSSTSDAHPTSESAAAPGIPGGRVTSGVTLQLAGVGLRQEFPETVYLRRDKVGAVTFQAAGRPSMPLKYLLDIRSRALLEKVVAAAVSEIGPSWSLLAEEDDEGRLLLTILH